MDRILSRGAQIHFDDRDDFFVVEEEIGHGSSCVTYLCHHTGKNDTQGEYLLKEYNPAHLFATRLPDGALVPKLPESFAAGLERFRASAQIQKALRQNSELKNATTIHLGDTYSANGTEYIIMPVFSGVTYDKLTDPTLYDTLKTLQAVAKTIAGYHRLGYLHLDIKPSNIFTLPETRELVMLFDFDSVVAKSEINRNGALSCTQSWAAPEQTVPSYRDRICDATDLFALGEILFTRVMGRHSEDAERRPFSTYQFDVDSDYLKNIDSHAYSKLTDFFRHTICSNVKRRWQSDDEFLTALEELTKLADPKEPHLISDSIPATNLFLGREQELDSISKMLNPDCKSVRESKVLFLTGIGGIGKTELAQQYARIHGNEYDVVSLPKYSGSWISCIDNIHLANFEEEQVKLCDVATLEKELPKYRKRKFRKLKELCQNSHVLFVIDNVDNPSALSDPDIGKLFSLNGTFLITSRLIGWEQKYPTLPISELDFDSQIALFEKCLSTPLNDPAQQTAVREIIELFQGHTMAIQFVAKLISVTFSSPSKMLEMLQTASLSAVRKEHLDIYKDGAIQNATIGGHLLSLFDISALTHRQKVILTNLAMIPPFGIDGDIFSQLCEIDNCDSLSFLIKIGLISQSGNYISIHPMIGELALGDFLDCRAELHTFLIKLSAWIISIRGTDMELQAQADTIVSWVQKHTETFNIPNYSFDGLVWELMLIARPGLSQPSGRVINCIKERRVPALRDVVATLAPYLVLYLVVCLVICFLLARSMGFRFPWPVP